jgi:Recombinase
MEQRKEPAKRVLAERGQGRKRYGFYEGEQAVIARMKALQVAGLSYERIAGQLNAAGVQPRAGGRWWGKTVNNILRQAGVACGQGTAQSTADRMLEEMRKLEPGWTAPVSIRELREAMTGVDAAEFDRAALELWREQRVYLSQHDFPQGERPETVKCMVRHGDRYFVAITARRPQ